MKDGKLMENKGGTWSTVTTTFICGDGSKVSYRWYCMLWLMKTTKKLNERDKNYERWEMCRPSSQPLKTKTSLLTTPK